MIIIKVIALTDYDNNSQERKPLNDVKKWTQAHNTELSFLEINNKDFAN